MSQAKASPVLNPLTSTVTVWKCTNCHSFITVEALEPVYVKVCPACHKTPVAPCADNRNNLELPWEDDMCGDYYPHGW